MASPHDTVSMAVFCDFENVALGVRDAKYEKFDIKKVLERLLLKGSIVVKKAYCDWERYKGFKATMHEASFELIEIPHVRQSGKNSADIRLVVDALDLCYTKSHVNTFVIISGDSDFSPLVSKLRENAKQVIGVGVKQSTSDLLIANCDEFIFYDDLVRESQRAATRREPRETQPAKRPEDEKQRKDEMESRRADAIELAVETFDALVSERGDSGRMWASVLKEAIKRRKPGFNESYYGFRTFGNLLEEAQARGLLEFSRDEKSGTYVYRSTRGTPAAEAAAEPAAIAVPVAVEAKAEPASPAETPPRREGRRRRRGEHAAAPAEEKPMVVPIAAEVAAEPASPEPAEPKAAEATPAEAKPAEPARKSARRGERKRAEPKAPEPAPAAPETAESGALQAKAAEPQATEAKAEPRRRTRGGRGKQAAKAEIAAHTEAALTGAGEGPAALEPQPAAPVDASPAEAAPEKAAKPARKSAPRSRRPRKQESSPDRVE